MYDAVLENFGLPVNNCKIAPYGSGLINKTWLVETSGKKFILQRINEKVFEKPLEIDFNIQAVSNYLKHHHPAYKFITPLLSITGEYILKKTEGYFRLFDFVEDSKSYNTAESEELAYEAAKQFGKFTALLSSFDSANLNVILPKFHDISYRYNQFLNAVKFGNIERINSAAVLINEIQQYSFIINQYKKLRSNDSFKIRVIHHDTKINNVLFDDKNKGICIVDLDTVMPGYFISDVGDMMRTYLPAVSEDETDISKIYIRPTYFEAIVNGYIESMQHELSLDETSNFFYGGQFMMYMQALRFITDYLNDDVYYGATYEQQNLDRARNQLTLLNKFSTQEKFLKSFIRI